MNWRRIHLLQTCQIVKIQTASLRNKRSDERDKPHALALRSTLARF